MPRSLVALTALALLSGAVPVTAADYAVAFKDHRIVPAELEVPAGQKIRLVVQNQDPTPEEFESHSLNREKIIPGNSKTTVFIGPLKPGRYEIFGEFNPDTARGWIVVK